MTQENDATAHRPIGASMSEVRIYVLAEFRCQAEDMHHAFRKLRVDEAGRHIISGVPLLHTCRAHDESVKKLVWAEVDQGGLIVADDLHPAVVAALGGPPSGQAARRLPALQITNEGRNLVNGVYARPPGDPRIWPPDVQKRFVAKASGLNIALSPAARARLQPASESPQTQDHIRVTVADITLLFPSSFGLVLMELALERGLESGALAEEVLHVITNRGRHDASTLATVALPTAPATTSDLLEVVLPSMHCAFETWNRLYTYTLVLLPTFGAISATKSLAVRLARHHTSHYDLSESQIEETVFQPFSDVVHSFTLEGAASVADRSSPFLGEQFFTRAKQAYLPLVAMAYHEHAMLVELAQRSVTGVDRSTPSLAELENLIEDFVRFRLRYRMPLVSDIDMHNVAYATLRKSLKLDELIEKLAQDATEAARLLAQRAEQSLRRITVARRARRARTERWLAPTAGFLMFGLTFLAFHAVFEEFEKASHDHFDWGSHWPWIAAGLVGLLAAGLQFRRHLIEAKESEGEIEEHTLREDVVHVARTAADEAEAAAAAGTTGQP